MERDALVCALESGFPHALAADLVDCFLRIRQDAALATLGGSAPGKFVETLVQLLQYLDSGAFEPNPNVDSFLRELDSRPSPVPDGLRLCASRVARAMYTLRNKRNIAHKSDVDANVYDLNFLNHASQWIMSEVLRSLTGLSMAESGRLIQEVQAPVGSLVQDFGGRRLVLHHMAVADEILVVLHSLHPDRVALPHIISCLDRRKPQTVRNAVRTLWSKKAIDGDVVNGYQLTLLGLGEAINTVKRCLAT